MKYWKEGFYDTPIEGCIEISEEHYYALLAGQEEGKIIISDQNDYPVLVYPPAHEKDKKLAQLTEFDRSTEINSFTIQGVQMWIDKETRTGLKLRFDAEIAAGKTTTTLWYGTTQIQLPLNVAQQMLFSLEVYASECFDRTQAHRAAILTLETDEAIKAYDFKTGYPDKLVL
ncbi:MULTISPECIES: DUF4376 domain-containing protein [Porphyromonadaceae]|uniref:DUF4376 domain-containing protein n=1 Tax=Porphyromonadaceae TaxID=171551 RepID=UPI000D8E002D|nr:MULTISPECIES: DUF4376 domain-containing protein [Porphyromonadaceae]MCR9011948.1 DUF4376 domain-containing protein [Gabonibacter chumensis]PXZ44903.1 hypothetical protein DMB45_00195 [Sanguibacteroides justesenii]